MITVTDSAIRQLQSLVAEKGEPGKGLRILVENGGCAGMQYGMGMDEPKPDDEVVERDGVRVMVDRESLKFLTGSTIDYCDDLTRRDLAGDVFGEEVDAGHGRS